MTECVSTTHHVRPHISYLLAQQMAVLISAIVHAIVPRQLVDTSDVQRHPGVGVTEASTLLTRMHRKMKSVRYCPASRSDDLVTSHDERLRGLRGGATCISVDAWAMPANTPQCASSPSRFLMSTAPPIPHCCMTQDQPRRTYANLGRDHNQAASPDLVPDPAQPPHHGPTQKL